MAWDTEGTRQRLKHAATEEFAAHGLHGTTMDKIARRAGINKERLYHYFGSKEQLFGTILSDELAKAAAAVPLGSPDDTDLGEYAGRVYDYHAAHPQLMRLLHWEALSCDAPVPNEKERTLYYDHKVEAFTAAQHSGTLTREPDADHLLFLTLALSTWWFGVPQLARMVTGTARPGSAEHARRRASVVTAARRLAGVQHAAG